MLQERYKYYLTQIKEIADKEKAPKLDKNAAKRFVRNALWAPDTGGKFLWLITILNDIFKTVIFYDILVIGLHFCYPRCQELGCYKNLDTYDRLSNLLFLNERNLYNKKNH